MKTRGLIFLATVLSFYTDLGLAQGHSVLLEQQKTSSLASYLLVIPDSEFTRESLIRLAHSYLDRQEKLQILDLSIHTDQKSARASLGKSVFDLTYANWKNEFEKRKREKLTPSAELLKYGEMATLRIQYSDGKAEEIEIVGRNAFHPLVDGICADLLHVSFVLQGFGKSKELIPHFYFGIYKELAAAEAEHFSRSFLAKSGISNMEIHLREDEWFIFDAHYPWVNSFGKSQIVPTETEVAKSAEFLCRPAEQHACYQISAGASQQ